MEIESKPGLNPFVSSVRIRSSNPGALGLRYAFQPIVNVHTGSCLGFEALVRNVAQAGASSIEDYFSNEQSKGRLAQTEALLHRMACESFASIPFHRDVRLFFNIRAETVSSSPHLVGQLLESLHACGIEQGCLCLDVCEGIRMVDNRSFVDNLVLLREQGFRLALDDFGVGYSGLQLLYEISPDFVKIDRFFVCDIAQDPKKRLFLSNITNTAHSFSSMVIAEGVETIEEFYICRDLGCDLMQGTFVQEPVSDTRLLRSTYETVVEAVNKDRRKPRNEERRLVENELQQIPPVHLDTAITEIFDVFRTNKEHDFFPVVNTLNEPLGLVRGRDLKEYVYSLYGRELLRNRSRGHCIKEFLASCPLADIHTPVERILELFSLAKGREGILIVHNQKYHAFLSAESLLRIIHERNIECARDQNPLTKLPGNYGINRFITAALQDIDTGYVLAYFDFDHFKPFNDTYGFRAGDRAIVLFGEILNKMLDDSTTFIGHIGGDDFFAGFTGVASESVIPLVRDILARFKAEAESLYEVKDREQRCIVCSNRQGVLTEFPLLTVSCACVELAGGRTPCTFDTLARMLARVKKEAKSVECGLAFDRP